MPNNTTILADSPLSSATSGPPTPEGTICIASSSFVTGRKGAAGSAILQVTSDNPENLWKALQSYQEKTGGQVLAIPHNGNLSNGLMFPMINPVGGKPLTREYAETRARS